MKSILLVALSLLTLSLDSMEKKMPASDDPAVQRSLHFSSNKPDKPLMFLRVDPSSYEFAINGDFLFQRVYRRGMDFAVNTLPTGPAAQLPNGVTFNTNYSFSNGYEVYAALRTPNRWSFELIYMHFDTKNSKNVAQTPQTLVATRGLTGTIGTQGAYDQARAKARLDWDIYTFKIGRTMNVGTSGEFTPCVGVRWSYLDQDFEALYIRSVSVSSVDKVIEETHSSLIGAMMGGLAKYYFVPYFGLSAGLDIAFMRADQRLNNYQLNNDVQEVNYKEIYYQIVPALESSFGLFAHWEYFTVNIGYQFKYWADAAYSARSDADNTKLGQFIPVEYDLSLSGLYLGVELKF